MPSFAVRFKGLLFQHQRARLSKAGIDLVAKEPGMQIDEVKTGRPIHTVLVEADTEEQAMATVKAKLTPDDVNFSNWEAGLA
jgi:hypothetical protein